MKPVVKKIIYMIVILCIGIFGLLVTDQYSFMHQLNPRNFLANSKTDLKTVQSELGQVGRGMPAESKIIKER